MNTTPWAGQLARAGKCEISLRTRANVAQEFGCVSIAAFLADIVPINDTCPGSYALGVTSIELLEVLIREMRPLAVTLHYGRDEDYTDLLCTVQEALDRNREAMHDLARLA